jgi:predicted dehydrogenase
MAAGAPRKEGPVLALVGGGRWGRVLAGELAKMNLPCGKVVVVSQENAQAMARLIGGLASPATTFELVPSIDELLAGNSVAFAIIANAAHQHFGAASRLIEHGAHVLVEKPLVLASHDAHALVQSAAARGVRVVPGLQYRFCTYVHAFREQLRRVPGEVAGFSLSWADAASEIRYGEAKTYDARVDVAQDIMPHVFTILVTVFGDARLAVPWGRGCASERLAEFGVRVGELTGHVRLERDADRRQRLLTVVTSSGDLLSLDFAVEPGTILAGTEAICGDPEWQAGPRPLAVQLAHFFGASEPRGWPTDAELCLASVAFAEEASQHLRSSAPI